MAGLPWLSAPQVRGQSWGMGSLVTNGGALLPTFCLPWPSQSRKMSSSHLLLSWQSYWLGEEREQGAPSPTRLFNGKKLTPDL